MISSVCRILFQRFGVGAAPGAKVKCPVCHHDTLQIHREDTVAKCFHPTCGWYASAGRHGHDDCVSAVLEDLLNDWHDALIKRETASSQKAYGYCTATREIAPEVIAVASVGVVPERYDLRAKFEPYIRDLRDASDAARARENARSRTSQVEAALERLREAADALHRAARFGWLAFFYFDASGKPIAVRFRNPAKKEFTYFKPFAIAGVFGDPLDIVSREQPARTVIVEGEFNQLRLVTTARAKPAGTSTMRVFAVGGVNNVDGATVARISSIPLVIYDNDQNRAGEALVATLAQAMTLDVVTTPGEGSDIDQFINEQSDDPFEAVERLFASAKRRYRPYAAVRTELDGIRAAEGGRAGLKRFEVVAEVVARVITDLSDRGQFYSDGQTGYALLKEEGIVAPIAADDRTFDTMMSRYGLGPGQDVAKPVREQLRIHALTYGERAEVYPFAHWSRERRALYVYDFDRTVYKIKSSGITAVANGTDGVLFLRSPKYTPFQLLTGDAPKDDLFSSVVVGTVNFSGETFNREEVLKLLKVWYLSLYFPELFPTRPILAVIGEKGSGKSSILRRIGKATFGPEFNVTQLSDDPKDFDAIVTHDAFVALDNVDTCSKWLEDRLAVSATGGRVSKRELHTTNRLVSFPIRAFIGVTSRTPHFRREDVADRLLPIHVERYATFRPESDLLNVLLSSRDAFMTQVLNELQGVVETLEKTSPSVTGERLRMADFVDFALRVASGRGWGDEMRSIVGKIASEQATFALEAEPIVELLEEWLEINDGENVARMVSTKQLCIEFAALAAARSARFEYTGRTQVFGQRLTNIVSTLGDRYEIKQERRRGRKRYVGFRPLNDSTDWHDWQRKHDEVPILNRTRYSDITQ